MNKKKISLGAGCFWHVQAMLNQQDGIISTKVGYQGGLTQNPTYEAVCTQMTNHAEVVLVEYDEDVVTTEGLLEIFFQIHDPTTLNRQGPDIGSSYRSVIFCNDEEQKAIAQALIRRLDESQYFQSKIVTKVENWAPFYLAEDYHDCYLQKRGL